MYKVHPITVKSRPVQRWQVRHVMTPLVVGDDIRLFLARKFRFGPVLARSPHASVAQCRCTGLYMADCRAVAANDCGWHPLYPSLYSRTCKVHFPLTASFPGVYEVKLSSLFNWGHFDTKHRCGQRSGDKLEVFMDFVQEFSIQNGCHACRRIKLCIMYETG